MARRSKPRRGVLLLIVLSLLILFLLVGLSFVVSASQFKRLTDQAAKTELTGMPGDKLANAAMYQILRGTNNQHSKVRRHSLLEDTYGRDYFRSTANSVEDYESNGTQQTQVIRFNFGNSQFTSEGNSVPLTKLDDYFGGCVLTYTSGNAKGKSTRVVKFDLTPPAQFAGESIIVTLGVRDDQFNPPMPGSEFIINGRPMNGVGAGFNPGTGRMDAKLTLASPFEVPAAFAPNYSAHTGVFDYGGLDEPWDNVDYQNMFLAKPANPTLGISENQHEFIKRTAGAIPSFHRPFLYKYLETNYSSDWTNPALRHAFVLRPSPMNHPGFTGSNPGYDPINGPWDVDNDGDGTPDSVWIDFGLSLVTGPDGRLYKPLIAPMILPLDGRLNANTGDSLQRLTIDGTTSSYVQFASAVTQPTAAVTNQNAFGAGFGPADVALASPGISAMVAQRNKRAGAVAAANIAAGNEGVDDDTILKANGIGDFPTFNNYVTDFSLLTGFGSPADLFGRGLPFIDTTGNLIWRHPVTIAGGALQSNDGLDDPYEVDPYQKSATDSLFTLTELESQLRKDANAMLLGTDRILPAFLDNKVTTISSYIPAPASINSGRFRNASIGGDGLRRSIRDVIAARIRRDATTPLTEAEAFSRAEAFMPAELVRGEKLDLNRALRPNNLRTPTNPQGNLPAVDFRILREKQRFARDLYHMMMLVTEPDFLLPQSANMVENLNALQRRRLFARRVAQWAINVVDFGDADSVMTSFVFNPNPFSGPLLDPDRSSYPAVLPPTLDVVWGCEHPELLLTETLAFHDRRVKDMSKDGMRKNTNTGEEDDDDLDQPVPPQGSLFVELYCPRAIQSQQIQAFQQSLQQALSNPKLSLSVAGMAGSAADLTSHLPEDLYTGASLDLAKVPFGSTKPTWRIAISERHLRSDDAQIDDEKSALEARRTLPDIASFEPDDFDLRVTNENQDLKELKLERFIWFSNAAPGGAGQEELPRNTYYARPDANSNFTQAVDVSVNPGDYVVIGPRQVTPVGLKANDPLYGPSTQRIDLANTFTGSLSGTPRRGSKPARVVPIIAQTANEVGVSISEPTDTSHYYPSTGAGGKYLEPYDTPFDEEDPDEGSTIPTIEQRPLWEPLPDPDAADESAYTLASGTRENIRTVFLQRLANPNLPWNAVTNPYRTIDWMPVDLTVFNSLDEETGSNAPDGLPFDPRDPEDVEVLGASERWERQDPVTQVWAETEFNFGSREKSGPGLNIWSAETATISTTRWKPAAQQPNVPYVQVPQPKNKAGLTGLVSSLSDNPLYHTLGWLNRAWDTHGPISYDGDGHFRVDPTYGEAPMGYLDPETNLWTTFPTFVWNNRPYANEYETMLVPACSQGRLTHEYTVSQATPPIFFSDPFAAHYGGFHHLLNFFQSTRGVAQEQLTPANNAPNYHRIFDYVNVPSRFKSTRDWFNTSHLTASNPFAGDPSYSKFREPGRISMNTTAADSVFMDMGMDGLPVNAPPENRFFNARDFEQTLAGNDPRPNASLGGAPISSDNERFPNGKFPAMYPNPLRASAAADLRPDLLATTLAVDATLLRSSSSVQPGQAPFRQPALAKYKDQLLTGDLLPQQLQNGLSQFGQAFQNRKTNAFFRYRDIQKAGASASAQTNVFAVWITVGYFEIEPNYQKTGTANYNLDDPFVVDPLHPDGYTLGAEMGSELGNVTRHRSFFIIDRSIPVAFEPGVNHNVDDAVLLRRNLE